jgi:hypothetical protein
MAAVGYKVQSLASNALTASATRTVVGAKSGAAFGLQVKKWGASFNGSAAAAGIECQLVYCTFGANAPGTNSTSITPVQAYGRVLTAGFTAAGHWTTEPTTITLLDSRFIQQSGAYEWSTPLGQEDDCALGEGFAVRLITPAAVTPNYVAHLVLERV